MKKKSNKHGGGAKSKYSAELAKKICDYIRGGLPKAQSAILSGLAESTFFAWQKSNVEFSESIKSAEAEFENNQLLVIREATLTRYGQNGVVTRRGSWQASAWMLERKFPDRYAERFRGEISGKDGGPITVEVVNFATAAYARPKVVRAGVDVPRGTIAANGHGNGNGNGNGNGHH